MNETENKPDIQQLKNSASALIQSLENGKKQIRQLQQLTHGIGRVAAETARMSEYLLAVKERLQPSATLTYRPLFGEPPKPNPWIRLEQDQSEIFV